MREIKDDTLNRLREADNKRIYEAFNDGYHEAANICVGILEKKIDELLSQIKSGSYLSEQEQFMLSKLNELKSETEEELRNFWNRNE